MDEADAWLEHLRATGRKDGTIRTHRNNIRQCLQHLQWMRGEPRVLASTITESDIHFLWSAIRVKEAVRRCYLRSLAGMIVYYTGVDIVKKTDILYNREVRDRVFIEDDELAVLMAEADPLQRLIISLGVFMGLRRCEMQGIRESDIHGHYVTIHGKGHGEDGLVATVRMPEPVIEALGRYRRYKATLDGTPTDDYVIQTRGHRGQLHMIHEAQISAAVHELSERTGIRATTHSFRRYFGTTLYYKTDCDIQTVRKLMRHADVSTTLKCYVDAYDERERTASDQLTGHILGIISG